MVDTESSAGDLLVACFKGDTALVRELLEDGVSPDSVSAVSSLGDLIHLCRPLTALGL